MCIRDSGEVTRACTLHRGDEVLGNAAEAEASHQDGGAVAEVCDGGVGIRYALIHDCSREQTASCTGSLLHFAEGFVETVRCGEGSLEVT